MESENKDQKKVKCPQCGLFALYSPENIYRPFCSERCKIIDLGDWASEKYRIPQTPTSSDSLTSYDDPDDDDLL